MIRALWEGVEGATTRVEGADVWTENTIMMEITPERGHCQSMYSLVCG